MVRHGAVLLLERPGSGIVVPLYAAVFNSKAERDGVLAAAKDRETIEFWGRLVLALRPAQLEPILAALAAKARKAAQAEAEARRQRAQAHRTIQLFIRDRKQGFYLELTRMSDTIPAWSIRFAGRAERDRLCDWLRWQKFRFAAFLAFAAEHGDHALERHLVDAMFATEARLKKEGRAASGLRPLRMWRGE